MTRTFTITTKVKILSKYIGPDGSLNPDPEGDVGVHLRLSSHDRHSTYYFMNAAHLTLLPPPEPRYFIAPFGTSRVIRDRHSEEDVLVVLSSHPDMRREVADALDRLNSREPIPQRRAQLTVTGRVAEDWLTPEGELAANEDGDVFVEMVMGHIDTKHRPVYYVRADLLTLDPLPEPRFYVKQNGLGVWLVVDRRSGRAAATYGTRHPNPETSARVEAARLNE